MKRLHHPAPASPTNPLPVKASYYPHQLDTPSSREYPRTSQPSISTTSVGHNNPPNHLNGKRRRINRWAYSIRSIPNRTTGREEYPRPSFFAVLSNSFLFFEYTFSSLSPCSLGKRSQHVGPPFPVSSDYGLSSHCSSLIRRPLFPPLVRREASYPQTTFSPDTPICNSTVFGRGGEEGCMFFFVSSSLQDAKLHLEDHNRQLLTERRNAVCSPFPSAPPLFAHLQ